MQKLFKSILFVLIFIAYSFVWAISIGEKLKTNIGVLKIEMKIGYGKNGDVYLATDENQNKYAIKILKPDSHYVDQTIINMNLNQLQFWPLEKGEIVDENQTQIKYEVMPLAYSDVFSILSDGVKKNNLDKHSLIQLAYEVYQGVLDEIVILSQNGIIHTDIKPGNIAFNAKTKKFGLIDLDSLVRASKVSSGFTLTNGFYPESIGRYRDYNPTIELYALAITIVRIFDVKAFIYSDKERKILNEAKVLQILEEMHKFAKSRKNKELTKKFQELYQFVVYSIEENNAERFNGYKDFFRQIKKENKFEHIEKLIREQQPEVANLLKIKPSESNQKTDILPSIYKCEILFK